MPSKGRVFFEVDVLLCELCQECLQYAVKSCETVRSHHPSNQKTCRNEAHLLQGSSEGIAFGPVHCVSNTMNGSRLPRLPGSAHTAWHAQRRVVADSWTPAFCCLFCLCVLQMVRAPSVAISWLASLSHSKEVRFRM